MTSPVSLITIGQPLLNTIPGIPQFSGTEREKDTVQFEQWYHAILDACRNFSEPLVRATITKSCVGDAADAMCCLPPGATLDDILEKFKWLYGSVESSDTLMQEFYHIAQGKSEKVQTFVPHFEWALKAIKQQYPYAMTKEEGHRHLKDHLFHGLKPNLCNALHYLYDKPDSQYSQLVMASRKAEMERLGSSVSKDTAKSAIVGTNTDLAEAKASSEPSYEAITQQIAYLMSAVANQVNPESTKPSGYLGLKPNGNNKYSPNTFQRPKCNRKNMTCWGCGLTGHSWRECSTPRQENTLPFRPNFPNSNLRKKAKFKWPTGEGKTTLQSSPSNNQGGIHINRELRAAGTQTDSNYYNPNPWARILGGTNETDVEIDGLISNALTDSGAMISMMSKDYCYEQGYKIQPLEHLVPIEGSGGPVFLIWGM